MPTRSSIAAEDGNFPRLAILLDKSFPVAEVDDIAERNGTAQVLHRASEVSSRQLERVVPDPKIDLDLVIKNFKTLCDLILIVPRR